jgi:hypothetical protein
MMAKRSRSLVSISVGDVFDQSVLECAISLTLSKEAEIGTYTGGMPRNLHGNKKRSGNGERLERTAANLHSNTHSIRGGSHSKVTDS